MYKTNYLMLVFIAALALGAGYLACTLKQVSYPEPVIGKYERKEKLEKVKIGDLEISYPNLATATSPNESYLSFGIKKFFVSFLKEGVSNLKRNEIFPMSVIYSKNVNPKKLSIKDWWEIGGAGNGPQAPLPETEEVIKINDIDAYKVVYYAPTQESYYYVPVEIYIPHNTDIYEIRGYQLPENPDPALTLEDIQAAHEYEAIFNQIIQSIKFVYSVSS